MTDDPNNSAQALAHRAQQVEQQGKETFGDEAWNSAVKSLERRMAAGEMSQMELHQTLAKPDAAGRIFNSFIADAPESEWRRWRDRGPHRSARIDRCR